MKRYFLVAVVLGQILAFLGLDPPAPTCPGAGISTTAVPTIGKTQ